MDRHSPTEGHPQLPLGQQTRGAGHADSARQDGGWAGTDPAAGQPPRPDERKGKEARPSPQPCGKGLPGAPTSPAAPAGREAPDSSRRRSRPSAAAPPPAAL